MLCPMKNRNKRELEKYWAKEADKKAKLAKKATRTYTHQDVERQNQKNGEFKYDGKAGKIQ